MRRHGSRVIAACWALMSIGSLACAPRDHASPHEVLGADVEPLRAAFNADSGRVRIVMLVSPTCGECLHGASEIERAVLGTQPSPRLRAYVVWVPKLYGREQDVPLATRYVPDARARHYWDALGVLVRQYDTVLGLGEDAWDIYMVYGPRARWDGATPPRPDFWMHQLGSPGHPRVGGPYLAPAVFAAYTDSLLAGG
jgi:hypothetical protein